MGHATARHSRGARYARGSSGATTNRRGDARLVLLGCHFRSENGLHVAWALWIANDGGVVAVHLRDAITIGSRKLRALSVSRSPNHRCDGTPAALDCWRSHYPHDSLTHKGECLLKNLKQRLVWAIVMGGGILAANGVAVFLRHYYKNPALLGLAVGATAVITFVGILALCQEPDGPWKITERTMRTAMAASIMAQYQALVAIVAFFSAESEKPSEISQTLISNFTTVVGIVIAFYFGASAFVEGRRISANRTSNPSAEPGSSTSRER